VLPGKQLKPEDLLLAVWRRKWFAVVPFVLIAAGTAIVAAMLPDRYRSETVMLVEPQRVPQSYVRATVTTRLEDRLRSIQAQILSRTKLEQIITDAGLYPEMRKRLPMEDVVENMRKNDVRVELVRGDAFRVSFTSENPRKAKEVAEKLASAFVNENLQDRETLANATTQFLDSQLSDARRRLIEAEGKVAEFQRRHAGALPSERDSNLTILHNLELQVQALLDSMNRERDRLTYLERALADLEAQALALRSAPASATASQPGASAGATTAEQLEAARNALKALEVRAKPEHPDVQYLKRVISGLEAKVAAEAAAAQPGTAAGDAIARARTPEEASLQRRILETRQEIARVRIQVDTKAADEKRLRGRIAEFQGRVAATPALTAEFTSITRDYDTIRQSYISLLAKYEDAKAAAALEQQQGGEWFRTLDSARLPESPVSPNRPLINLLGALAGLGVGLGLVALLEYRDHALRTEDEVWSVLKVPVLAAVPVILTRADRARQRRRRLYRIAGAAAAVVVLAGSVVAVRAVGLQRLAQWFR
jgi:polysaccharide chain length determinant protein (PEP-CTERM system associated)